MQGREGARALVCLRSYFLCLRMISEDLEGVEGVRTVLTTFLIPTMAQCKKVKQVQI